MVCEVGVTLLVAAVLLALVPATVSPLLGRQALHVPVPLALGAVIGQQCSTPALTVLQQRGCSDAPLFTYVKVHALSNIVLPLLAPSSGSPSPWAEPTVVPGCHAGQVVARGRGRLELV